MCLVTDFYFQNIGRIEQVKDGFLQMRRIGSDYFVLNIMVLIVLFFAFLIKKCGISKIKKYLKEKR